MYDNASLDIESSLFENNKAKDGGALRIWDNATIVLKNSTFLGNTASQGSLFTSYSASITLDTCKVINALIPNTLGFSSGSNVFIQRSLLQGIVSSGSTIIYFELNSNVFISDSRILSNNVTSNGGEIFSGVDSSMKVSHSKFNGNHITSCLGLRYSKLIIENSLFEMNHGRSLTSLSTHTMVEDSVFRNSTIRGAGAVIFLMQASELYMYNSTAEGNIAGTDGGVFAHYGEILELHTCVMHNNIAKNDGGVIVMDYTALTSVNSSFMGNIANRGGVLRTRSTGNVAIHQSNFTNNKALLATDIFYTFEMMRLSKCILDNNDTNSKIVIYEGGPVDVMLCTFQTLFIHENISIKTSELDFIDKIILNHGLMVNTVEDKVEIHQKETEFASGNFTPFRNVSWSYVNNILRQ